MLMAEYHQRRRKQYYTGWPKKNGTVDCLGLCSNQGGLRDGVPTGNNEFKQLSVL